MESASGATFPRFIRDRKWMPGRREHVIELRKKGFMTALATNQGGAAFGIFKPYEMDGYLAQISQELQLSAVAVEYTHPEGRVPELTKVSRRRKPGPGMLEEIIQSLHLLPSDALFVGDRLEDMEAAKAADIEFQWEKDYFSSIDVGDFWTS